MKKYFNSRLLSRMAFVSAFTLNFFSASAQTGIVFNDPTKVSMHTDRQFSVNSQPEWINCDIFDNANQMHLNNTAVMAIVYDEFVGGQWNCSLMVYDEHSGQIEHRLVALNARHPDVAITDMSQGVGMGQPGSFTINVVYEDLSVSPSQIGFTYFDAANYFFTTPSGLTLSGRHTMPGGNLGAGFGEAKYPHIDAIPDDLSVFPYYTTGTGPGNYPGVNHFVITWTEDDNSGSKRIYVDDGYIPVSVPILSYNPVHVADGEKSDIAGVRVQPSPSISERSASIIYTKQNSSNPALTDIEYIEYKLDAMPSPIITTPITLEAGLPLVKGWPRLDAFNINTSHTIWQFQAAAEVKIPLLTAPFISVRNFVHYYDKSGIVVETEQYCPFVNSACDPDYLSFQALSPSVSASTGPNPWGITSYGSYNLQSGYLLDNQRSGGTTAYSKNVASQLSSAGGHDGVWEINATSTTLDPTITPVLATAVGGNLGFGVGAAWNNIIGGNPVIQWKLQKPSTANLDMTYKPTAIYNVQVSDVTVSPNPANDVVNVSGIQAATAYTIVDVTGRKVMQGTVTPAEANINVSALNQGIYILNVNDNGNSHQFKLMKH